MFTYTHTFSSFSVNDVERAQKFYSEVLGVDVRQTAMGLELHVQQGEVIFVYQKEDHVPATYTVLNFVVSDIDAAVGALMQAGVAFEHYEGGMLQTDEKGIARSRQSGNGPDIAWFKDPAGNFLSVLQE